MKWNVSGKRILESSHSFKARLDRFIKARSGSDTMWAWSVDPFLKLFAVLVPCAEAESMKNDISTKLIESIDIFAPKIGLTIPYPWRIPWLRANSLKQETLPTACNLGGWCTLELCILPPRSESFLSVCPTDPVLVAGSTLEEQFGHVVRIYTPLLNIYQD